MRALLIAFVLLLVGCKTVEHAAAQDPQRCERDPKCNGHQDKSRDCITACADNRDCIDRCEQVTGQNH